MTANNKLEQNQDGFNQIIQKYLETSKSGFLSGFQVFGFRQNFSFGSIRFFWMIKRKTVRKPEAVQGTDALESL